MATPTQGQVIGWVTLSDDLPEWTLDADPATLQRSLEAAHEQCVEYLNGHVPDPVPARLIEAQLLQTRALLRSSAASANDGIGLDGQTVTVFPMDWTVKNLLRPKRGKRRVL